MEHRNKGIGDLFGARTSIVAFLLISIPILLWLCVANGPFQAPDEVEHYFRSIQLSEGRVAPVLASGRKRAGDYLDTAPVKLGGYYEHIAGLKGLPFASGPEDTKEAWSMQLTGRRTFADFSNTVIYFPLAHAAPAAAIAVARAVGLPPIAWLYAGRAIDAALAVAIFCVALWLFPEGRLFVFALALLPRVLFSEAAISADALLVPMSALYAALLCRLVRDPFVPRWQMVLLGVATFFVCVNKLAYIPLVVLPPLFAWLKQRRLCEETVIASASALITLAVWAGWMFSIKGKVFPIRYATPIDVGQQLAGVIADPLHFAKAIMTTFVGNPWWYVRNIVAGDMGGPGNQLSPWTIFPSLPTLAVLAVVIAVAFIGNRAVKARPLALGASIVIMLGVTVVILLSLYLQNTAVGMKHIDGFQGRYLLPILCLPVAFLPKVSVGRFGRHLSAALVAFFVVTSAYTGLMMERRYWHPQPVDGLRLHTSTFVNLRHT